MGILIGGTLGQQWINHNQQKIIEHYEVKIEKMEIKNNDLVKMNQKLNDRTAQLMEDFKTLFTLTVTNTIAGDKFLWFDKSTKDLDPLKTAIELAGGSIHELNNPKTIDMTFQIKEEDLHHYDLILFFTNKVNLLDDKWLLNYGIPVICVTDDKQSMDEESKALFKHYQHVLNLDSANEQYRFIHFLKNILQEKS